LATELQFNPFNQKHSFELDALKVRWFVAPRHVLTADVGFRVRSRKDVDNRDFKHRWTSHSNGFVRFNLGYQFVFLRCKRLELYIGAKAGYERAYASSVESFDFDRRVEYANWDNVDEVAAADIINAAVYTGLDFYVYRGLYLGVEFGVYLSDSMPVTQFRKTYSEGNYAEVAHKLDGHDLTVSTAASPLLRLGWRF